MGASIFSKIFSYFFVSLKQQLLGFAIEVKEKFMRGTKNCYLTLISKDFLEKIVNSQQYFMMSLKTRLWYKKQPLRIDEFRDYFETHLINNDI